MDTAASFVVYGYLLVCLALFVGAWFVSRRLGFNRTLGVVVAGVVALMLVPFWYFYGGSLYYDYMCSHAAGISIAESVKTTSFIQRDTRNDTKLVHGNLQCDASCKYWLGTSISTPSLGRVVLRGLAVELPMTNAGGYARLWRASKSDDDCMVPIPRDPDSCIAGKWVPTPSSSYEFVENPFRQCISLGPREQCWPSSLKSDYFEVKRYEHHLARDGKIVATVVAFERGSGSSGIFPWRTCPFEPRANGTWTRHFVDALFPARND